MNKNRLLHLEQKYLVKKSPMSLLNLLLTKRNDTRARNYPEKVGNYTFVKTLHKNGSKREFTIGIYKDGSGKQAFMKSCQANLSSFAYKGLLNEVRSYIVMQKVLSRIRKRMPKDLQKVEIPKLLDLIEYEGSLYLFTEFKKGEVATKKTHAEKIEAYFLVTRFLEVIGKYMTPTEKKVFARRTTYQYAFLFPFLLILAIKNNPQHAIILISGVNKFLTSLVLLHRESHLSLIHRDLHFNNILINKNKVILIDFQLMIWGEILTEFATTLRYRWGIDGFEDLFILAIQSRFSDRKNFPEIFTGLLANSVIHGLIDNSFPQQTKKRWLDLLKYTQNRDRQFKINIATQV